MRQALPYTAAVNADGEDQPRQNSGVHAALPQGMGADARLQRYTRSFLASRAYASHIYTYINTRISVVRLLGTMPEQLIAQIPFATPKFAVIVY